MLIMVPTGHEVDLGLRLIPGLLLLICGTSATNSPVWVFGPEGETGKPGLADRSGIRGHPLSNFLVYKETTTINHDQMEDISMIN
jgi:hypothetical protein